MDKLETRPRRVVPRGVAEELASAVFASLPRSDQRRKAHQYVRGLLETEGRKSIRRIAASTGERAAEQSLQHFVSCSTWDWDPVRAALAQRLEETLRPSAWVVRPIVIRKAGRHSVGVTRQLVRATGQSVNGQHAYGVWLAGEEFSAPVHWRLHLSAEWTDDARRRKGADIPDDIVAEPAEVTAATAAVEMAGSCRRLGRRPVVLDGGGEGDDGTGAATLAAVGLPFVARVSGTAGVSPADTTVPGYGRGPAMAHKVMGAVRRMRRPVEWLDPESALLRTSLAAKVPVIVHLPAQAPERARTAADAAADAGTGAGTGTGAGAQGAQSATGAGARTRRTAVASPLRLSLVAEWEDPYRWPVRFWLTDLKDVPVSVLLRLAKLSRRVDRDLTEVADTVGMRDFEGRTFPGWHRHTTLASVAHGAAVLAARTAPQGPQTTSGGCGAFAALATPGATAAPGSGIWNEGRGTFALRSAVREYTG